MCVCVRVFLCVSACMCVWLCVCVCVCNALPLCASVVRANMSGEMRVVLREHRGKTLLDADNSEQLCRNDIRPQTHCRHRDTPAHDRVLPVSDPGVVYFPVLSVWVSVCVRAHFRARARVSA